MRNLRAGYDLDSLQMGELRTKYLVFVSHSIIHALHSGLYIKPDPMGIGGHCFVINDYGYLCEVTI